MKIICLENGIFDIKEGIIANQVNCCDHIDTKMSKAIIGKWPVVESAYHAHCNGRSKTSLMGSIATVLVERDPMLFIANIFSQKEDEKAEVNTDMNALINAVKDLVNNYTGNVYVPEGADSGLTEKDWEQFLKIMKDTDLNIVKKAG